MESKQNRALKEFDSLYKMIDDVYHEIALSMFGREFSEKHIGPVFDMENATFESMEPSECEQLLSLTRKYVQILKKNTKHYILEEKEF